MLRATNIDRYCVKVSVKSAQDHVINQGSGVIIKSPQNYYVLTARHCVVTDDAGTTIADNDKIWIESQPLYNAPLQRIQISNLIKEDKTEDWAIFSIEPPPLHAEMLVTQIGENPDADEAVLFRGYQGRDSNQSRRFSGIIKDIGQNELKITLDKDTFNQGGQMGADVAKGLSGSGVFMFRNGLLYLIGHLKSVVDDYGLNDDIKCCVPSGWKQYLPHPFYINLIGPNYISWKEDKRKLNDLLSLRVYIEMQKYRQRVPVSGSGKAYEESILSNYIGVIAVEIQRLFSTGTEDITSKKIQAKYIKGAGTTARRCIQLLTFIFLCRWWDSRAGLKLTLEDATKNELTDLLTSASETSLTKYLSILRALLQVFKNNALLTSPIDEFNELEAECQPGRDFHDALYKLQEIENKLGNSSFTPTDCFIAEEQLTIVLETLVFMTNYKMAAIKEVVYHQRRNNTGRYQHSYCEIREFKESDTDRKIAHINYAHAPVGTDAIFFYKDDYEKGVNLSPFIIDLNSIDASSGAKIYFYKMRDLDNNAFLIYSCITVEKDEQIKFLDSPEDMPGIVDVLMQKGSDKFLQYRKDNIYRLFTEAQNDLLS